MNNQSLDKNIVLKNITDKCLKNNLTFIVYFNDENNFDYFLENKVIRNINDLKNIIYG